MVIFEANGVEALGQHLDDDESTVKSSARRAVGQSPHLARTCLCDRKQFVEDGDDW